MKILQEDCTEDAMRPAVSHCHGKTECEIPVGTSIVTHALGAVLGFDKKCGAWHDRHDYMEVRGMTDDYMVVRGMTDMTTWWFVA